MERARDRLRQMRNRTETSTPSTERISTRRRELPRSGTVRVTSRPSGAQIYIDQRSTSRRTPAEFEIPNGRHRIDLYRERYRPFRAEVKIEGSRQHIVEARLEYWPFPVDPEADVTPAEDPFEVFGIGR